MNHVHAPPHTRTHTTSQQVGLALEDHDVPQQARDIIPAFSVALGISTKVPKKRRSTLAQLEDMNIVDDLRALQLTLRVTVTRIKVFVSSYIAMKAVRMITNAQKVFGSAPEETKEGGASPTATDAGMASGSGSDSWAPTHFNDSGADGDADDGSGASYEEVAMEMASKMATAAKAILASKKEAKAAAEAEAGAVDDAGGGASAASVSSTDIALPQRRKSVGIQQQRSLGLSLLSMDVRVQLAGVDVYIAADLPTTNFGLSFHVNHIMVGAEVKKGQASLQLDLELSSQFQQALRQPFIETTKMTARVKFSCAKLLPPQLLA